MRLYLDNAANSEVGLLCKTQWLSRIKMNVRPLLKGIPTAFPLMLCPSNNHFAVATH